MVRRHERNGVIWVDLEAPSREELRAVMKEFDIGERVEEEIVSPTPYPLVLCSPHYSYLILHFPTTKLDGGARNQEIDFIVGKHFLITTRYEVVDSIHSLHRVFEAEELLGLNPKTHTTHSLVERVLRQLYGAIRDQAEQTAHAMDRIEDDIFAGKEREMVYAISLLGRVFLRFDTTLARHEEPLRTFLEDLSGAAFFGKGFRVHAAHIMAEHDHTKAIVNTYRAMLAELRTTNESLLTSTQNEVMKNLTIMAFVTFPLTLMAGIFGMNTKYLPVVGHPNDFWIIVGVMVLAAIGFFVFFRMKKWL